MKQKYLILSLVGTLFILAGCQGQESANSQRPTSSPSTENQNVQKTDDNTPTVFENGQNNPEEIGQSNSEATKIKLVDSAMLAMLRDGLEMVKTDTTKQQGLMMLEKGVALLVELPGYKEADTTLMSAEKKQFIQSVERAVNVIKDEKTSQDGITQLEKVVTEVNEAF